MTRHQVSAAGLGLIKTFEGYRQRAAQLPGGGWTVGYGHTRSAREGVQVSEADAEALLRYDLRPVEEAVNACVFTPLTPNQYDALVAFAFNVGVETFRRSNVLRRVNEGDLLAAAAALESWRRAEFEGEPIVIDALIRRRAAEKALFLTPSDGFIAAPSAVLKPELDFGVLAQRGHAAPAEVVTAMHGETVAPERLDTPAGEPELEPSPAQAAAEAVSKRLQALFADEPEPQPEAQPERAAAEEPAPELATDPALLTAPAPETGAESEPLLSHPTPTEEPLAVANDAEPDFDQRIARVAPDADVSTAPAEKESGWPYLILGLLALVLFAIAIVLVVDARNNGETGLLGPQSSVGGVLGVIGIAGFCTAVYFWLKTLGGEDRPQG